MTRSPDSASGPCWSLPDSSRSRPFPPALIAPPGGSPLRSPPSRVLCPGQTSSCRSSSASAYRLPSAAPATTRRGDAKISQVPMLDVRACLEVFDTAEPACPLPVAAQSVLPSAEVTASALRTRFTMLNALPTRAAVNASPTPSRQPAHDSRRSMNWLLLCSKGLSPSVHPPVSLAVPLHPRSRGCPRRSLCVGRRGRRPFAGCNVVPPTAVQTAALRFDASIVTGCRRQHHLGEWRSNYSGGRKGGIAGLFLTCYRRKEAEHWLEITGNADPGLQEAGVRRWCRLGRTKAPARLRRAPFAPSGPCRRPPLPEGSFRNPTHLQSFRENAIRPKSPVSGRANLTAHTS